MLYYNILCSNVYKDIFVPNSLKEKANTFIMKVLVKGFESLSEHSCAFLAQESHWG